MTYPYAIINETTGIIENCASWDGEAQWTSPVGCIALRIDSITPMPSIGWSYDFKKKEFSAPPEPLPVVPQSVSSFQAKAALVSANLYSNVVSYIANSANLVLQLAWSDAHTFERNSPTIATLQSQFGLSNTQIDTLFIEAGKIQA